MIKMTNAPKRIWVKGWSHTTSAALSEIIGTFSDRLPGTEYVPADLDKAEVDHLNRMLTNIAAENFKLRRAAFNLCTSKYPSAHDDLWALCKDYDLTND